MLGKGPLHSLACCRVLGFGALSSDLHLWGQRVSSGCGSALGFTAKFRSLAWQPPLLDLTEMTFDSWMWGRSGGWDSSICVLISFSRWFGETDICGQRPIISQKGKAFINPHVWHTLKHFSTQNWPCKLWHRANNHPFGYKIVNLSTSIRPPGSSRLWPLSPLPNPLSIKIQLLKEFHEIFLKKWNGQVYLWQIRHATFQICSTHELVTHYIRYRNMVRGTK